jgi:hypothetical protein
MVFGGHFGGKMVWIGGDLMRLRLFFGFWGLGIADQSPLFQGCN